MGYTQGQMIALGVVFLVLPTLFVGLRMWAKTIRRAGISWDDYLIFVALGLTIASCVVQLVAAIHGQLGRHQTVAPDGMPILDDPRFLLYERCKFALQMLSYSGYGFSKASILVFYMRIFTQRSFRLCAQVMLIVVAAWTITFFLTHLLQCLPITALVEPFYGRNCVNTIPMWYAGSISDIILDFMILTMPIPMVWKLQLPTKQKIGVLAMFLLGATACAASIARMVVFLQVGAALAEHFNDATYYTSPVFFWSVIEMALAVISACLPTLRPIYLHFYPPPPPHPYAKRSASYKPVGARYGIDHSGRSDTTSEEFRLPLTEREAGVQTHIETTYKKSPNQPMGGAIMVSQEISSTNRPVEDV